MSSPSSPASSSASDDFAALIDAELQSVCSDDDHEEDAEQSDKENIADMIHESARKRKERVIEDCHPKKSSEFKLARDDETDSIGETVADSTMGRGSKGSCPPHPGFMWGVCIRCGALKSPSEPGKVGVALRYIHEELELTEKEAARMRQDELKQILVKKKLYLVLDLDHTMLNSARFVELPPEETAYLSSTYFARKDSNGELAGGARAVAGGEEAVGINSSLHRLEHLHMWTKLRPFAHKFLEEASKMFEMYVYTMGERMYALAMAQLLDPKGRFFGSRVISQGDSTRRNIKDLDVMLGADSAVVILDDTEVVWPRHKANLILMERYHFFSSSSRQFGLQTASLVEAKQDESEEDGTLANILNILQSVHRGFFNVAAPEVGKLEKSHKMRDVREVIRSLRARVLTGCKVVFSRVFPMALPYPESHPLWRLTEELGAVCTKELDSSVTHVIARDRGTDKAKWAQQHGLYLVHPRWVDAALYTWKRPREEDYPVGFEQAGSTILSKTVTIEPSIREHAVDVDAAVKNSDPTEASNRVPTVNANAFVKISDRLETLSEQMH